MEGTNRPLLNPRFAVGLTASAIEVLHGLFIEGPLWDGDVPSKVGRDELVNFGLAARVDGYQFLTKRGIEMALDAGLHREKTRRYGEKHKALRLLCAVGNTLSPVGAASNDCCVAASPTAADAAGYMTASEIERRHKERAHADMSGRDTEYAGKLTPVLRADMGHATSRIDA